MGDLKACESKSSINSHNFFNNQGAVWNTIEEATDVRIQHPVHSLPMESHTERVQRLMWATPRPETIRKAPKVHLIDFVEDGHRGLLNDFVLQRRNTQRTLPPVSLRYIDSPRS